VTHIAHRTEEEHEDAILTHAAQ